MSKSLRHIVGNHVRGLLPQGLDIYARDKLVKSVADGIEQEMHILGLKVDYDTEALGAKRCIQCGVIAKDCLTSKTESGACCSRCHNNDTHSLSNEAWTALDLATRHTHRPTYDFKTGSTRCLDCNAVAVTQWVQPNSEVINAEGR